MLGFFAELMALRSSKLNQFCENLYSFTVFAVEATELLQKLSLDSQAKAIEVPEATKKVLISIPKY